MKRAVAVMIVISALVLCGCGGSRLHQTLEGTWYGEFMTVTFDFKRASFSGVVGGERFNHKMEIVAEETDFLVLAVNGNKIGFCVLENGLLMMQASDESPIFFTRDNAWWLE
jgi:hypothetical protein